MESKSKVVKMMDRMGYDPHLAGTEYTQEAIAFCMANRDASMTRDVYPAVAAARDVNWKSIERAMRYALRTAEDSPSFARCWDEIGGWREPTAGALVRRMARWARDEN